jgi:hypothetical protein
LHGYWYCHLQLIDGCSHGAAQALRSERCAIRQIAGSPSEVTCKSTVSACVSEHFREFGKTSAHDDHALMWCGAT